MKVKALSSIIEVIVFNEIREKDGYRPLEFKMLNEPDGELPTAELS